ncbi:MAG: PHP-associated domain-containing protein [bacterium]|nr:PHP-associated domain-containing protein [bacterium]MDT8367129.1 PHP-associated domain-containing protein [bacterium]
MRLKCDLHLHTKEDPRHQLSYSAKELIDAAAGHRYDVLSITNHNTVTYNSELADYAAGKGILLIPGVEATVMGKHVLIYGVGGDAGGTCEKWDSLSFFDLKRLKAAGAFIVAPHPFYPNYNCLGNLLNRFSTLFDAVEYSHLYTRKVNFNLKAQEFARENGIPTLGLSDAHSLKQLNYTYTLIDAEKEMHSIFQAIKEDKATIVTRPARISTSSAVGIQLFATFLLLQIFK